MLGAATIPLVSGATISTFQELSPTPTSFVFDVDQQTFSDPNGDPTVSAPIAGSATGFLFLVPNFGCNATDFTGFVSGDIALIKRGQLNCFFSLKALNAQNVGAIGYVIYDNNVEALPVGVVLGFPSPTIPGVFITQADGLALAAALQGGAVDVSLSVSNAPEPGPASLLALGLAFIGWKLKRRAA